MTENLILDHLRAIRSDIARMRENIDFLKQGVIAVRNEIHDSRGDLLRFEQRTETRLDRIEKRTALADA